MPKEEKKSETKIEATFLTKHGGKVIISCSAATIGGMWLAAEKFAELSQYAEKLSLIGLLFALFLYGQYKNKQNEKKIDSLGVEVKACREETAAVKEDLAKERQRHERKTSLFSSMLRYLFGIKDDPNAAPEARQVAATAISLAGVSKGDQARLQDSGIWGELHGK